LLMLIDEVNTGFKSLYPDMEFQHYRGDSLQIVFTDNKKFALTAALQLECMFIQSAFAIRLGIGVGDISFIGKDVSSSDGSAFQVSGPLVDELKRKGEWISIASTDKDFTEEWQVHSASLNFLLPRLSAQQAEAVLLHLQGKKQNDIAQALKISQPSVHQRLQAGGADVFMQMIARFENKLTTL